jgi:hypothetical protein
MDILSGGIPSPNLLPKGKSVVFGLLSIQQHQELLQTFDPRVKRLRHRRQILIHKDAFDDFE